MCCEFSGDLAHGSRHVLLVVEIPSVAFGCGQADIFLPGTPTITWCQYVGLAGQLARLLMARPQQTFFSVEAIVDIFFFDWESASME